jgi:hypothetical protein
VRPGHTLYQRKNLSGAFAEDSRAISSLWWRPLLLLCYVIDREGTLADTIFQAVINVEKQLWNVSQPDKIAKCMLPPC